MIVKYKVSDFAKDLNLSAKKVLDELNAMGSTGKKNSSNLEENELNYLLEKFSKDNSVANLDEFLNSTIFTGKDPRHMTDEVANKVLKLYRGRDNQQAARQLRKEMGFPCNLPKEDEP